MRRVVCRCFLFHQGCDIFSYFLIPMIIFDPIIDFYHFLIRFNHYSSFHSSLDLHTCWLFVWVFQHSRKILLWKLTGSNLSERFARGDCGLGFEKFLHYSSHWWKYFQHSCVSPFLQSWSNWYLKANFPPKIDQKSSFNLYSNYHCLWGKSLKQKGFRLWVCARHFANFSTKRLFSASLTSFFVYCPFKFT